jgi:hypothetical protein
MCVDRLGGEEKETEADRSQPFHDESNFMCHGAFVHFLIEQCLPAHLQMESHRQTNEGSRTNRKCASWSKRRTRKRVKK